MCICIIVHIKMREGEIKAILERLFTIVTLVTAAAADDDDDDDADDDDNEEPLLVPMAEQGVQINEIHEMEEEENDIEEGRVPNGAGYQVTEEVVDYNEASLGCMYSGELETSEFFNLVPISSNSTGDIPGDDARQGKQIMPDNDGVAMQTLYDNAAPRPGKELLTTGLRVQIGNGGETLIWRDAWLPTHPPRAPRQRNHIAINDHTVNTLFLPGTRQWNVELLAQIMVPEDVVLVKQILVSSFGGQDLLGWNYTDDGMYT
ncbi:hypothetical protein HID58_086523, partial [Brassica napus]